MRTSPASAARGNAKRPGRSGSARPPGRAPGRACRAAYSYGESGRTCPLRKAAREPESATLLFYSIPSRPCRGATYDLGTALGPAAMLARPAAVYRRTGTTHRLMCRCERGDGRTRPLTFSDYPLPSTDARASKLFMLRARVAAHRAAARLLLLRVTSPSRGPRSMWEVHLAPRAAAAIAGPPGLRLPRAQSR